MPFLPETSDKESLILTFFADDKEFDEILTDEIASLSFCKTNIF